MSKFVALTLAFFFLFGCAAPKVLRTQGEWDFNTRIYVNRDHNLRLTIPDYWTVVDDEAYKRKFEKNWSRGMELLVLGRRDDLREFVLVATRWVDKIEKLLKSSDFWASNPPIVDLVTERFKIGNVDIVERRGRQKKDEKFYCIERAFVHNGFAYRLVVGSPFPLESEDIEILENLWLGNVSLRCR